MIVLSAIYRPSTLSNMVKVEGVSQQWCDQFGTRVMAKLTCCYSNHPDLSLDNFINKNTVAKATGPVSLYHKWKSFAELNFRSFNPMELFGDNYHSTLSGVLL